MAARILVVEDHPDSLDLILYLLRMNGYITLHAIDGGEAIDMARRERPDLVICDVQLPTVDGYEVARQLRDHATLRAIPLVAVTALSMAGDQDKVLAAGFDGYYTKPIDPESFVAAMEHFLPESLRAIRPGPTGG